MRTQQDQQRRVKLHEVITLIAGRPRFRREEIQFLCREANPTFVTKVLNQLHQEGVLEREVLSGEAYYVWRDGEFTSDLWIDRQIVGDQVSQLPSDERPRERLLSLGAAELTNSELLAILIRSGRKGESAIQAGKRLSQRFSDRLMDLPQCSQHELKELCMSVSETAYCQIMAGIELGRRVAKTINERAPKPKINSTAAAIDFCSRHFERLASDAMQEEFHIVTLDTKLQPIQSHQITIGTLDASLVHPREVFKAAIRDSAAAILLVHNHPSGDPTPSRQDREITERLKKAGELLGVQVIDHIIVAKHAVVSLAES
jgi:DNA repair protein RadC